MRKKLIALMLALTTTIGLFGCSPSKQTSTSPDTTGGDNKITIWAWDPNFNIAIMNKAKELYIAENPDVEIEVVDFAKADVEQKLHTILAAGTAEDLPEIVLIEDYNAQKYLQSYPGAFADLTGKIPHEEFADYKVGFMTLDNKTYGVPFDSGVTGYFYRKDIIEEAGFKAEDFNNITWDRFMEIGKEVLTKTGKPMLSLDLNDLTILRMMISTSGLWYFNEEGREPYIAENAQLKRGMELMKEMIDTGVADLHSGRADLNEGYHSGKVAGVLSGVWLTPSIMEEKSQSGLWSIAPIPRLEESGKNAANLGGSSWYVLENSDSRDVAIDFLNKSYTNTDFYQDILTEVVAFGTYVPSMEGDAYGQEVEYFGGQKIFEDFSGWMKEVPSINPGIYTYEAESIVSAALNEYLNGGDLDQILKSAEEQLRLQIQ